MKKECNWVESGMVGLWIQIKGSCHGDERVRNEGLRVVVAVCQRSPKIKWGVKTSEPGDTH